MSTTLTETSKSTAATASTPMLKQFHAFKDKHPDCILFFRLGDFYEMFFEDAKIASRVLEVVLTSRGKGQAEKVPMCGFPHHAAQNYIAKLIKAGYKVAICEQVEDPAEAKGIVKRDVVRIITSGTYIDEHSTAARHLLCLFPSKKSLGFSFIDSTSGTIQTNQISLNKKNITEIISTLSVYECIFPEASETIVRELFDHPLLKLKNITLSPYDDWCFNAEIAHKELLEHFQIANLHGFGIDHLKEATASCGALLAYLKGMNKQPLKHIDKISLYSNTDYAIISPAAYRGLELESVIQTLDHTETPLGRRKFRHHFFHPLKDVNALTERQHAARTLHEDESIQQTLKFYLQKIPDIEKNISRLSCGYTHAKDFLAIRNTLEIIPEIQEHLKNLKKDNTLFSLENIPSLRKDLLNAINPEVPLSKPEGKLIAPGFHKELDDLRAIQDNGNNWLKDLQAREIQRTGISSLKIGFNKVFGYYLEVTKTNLANVPDDYIRKQTLVNAERFITPELKEYEQKILTAQDQILRIENELIQQLQKKILDHSLELHDLCQQLSNIDFAYSLSILAGKNNYIAPTIVDDITLDIKDGRHPVVEASLPEDFIANDTFLDGDNHLIILTGPNMAGKSTYIRQTAILAIMAQIGCYIPAKEATIGITDKFFTRIGAHDDISKGQSTFMVEMNETADILNNLTSRSLIILDEIGRGTSTYDGLSLAWALAEHLHTTKARTLFATHFHELTALANDRKGIKNYNVAVKEWKDEIIFLHKIIPGSTDDSYGIYVAKLAGIPTNVIANAKKMLTKLEIKNDLKDSLLHNTTAEKQLNLFNQNEDPILSNIRDTLETTDINQLTPLEGLTLLENLKQQINNP